MAHGRRLRRSKYTFPIRSGWLRWADVRPAAGRLLSVGRIGGGSWPDLSHGAPRTISVHPPPASVPEPGQVVSRATLGRRSSLCRGLRGPPRVDVVGRGPRGGPGDHLRRLVPVPRPARRDDGLGVDPGRRALDHAVSDAFSPDRSGRGRATILENNIVQTAGSAGESIAFGVGVTMPALMILGYDMEARPASCSSPALGGLLGILMMIPLRRAFIVKQHGSLPYPEGTACAKVLIVGEQGGSSARTVFVGFGLAFALSNPDARPETLAGVSGARSHQSSSRVPSLSCEASPDPAGRGLHHRLPRIAAVTWWPAASWRTSSRRRPSRIFGEGNPAADLPRHQARSPR